jgi:predicted GH43/DUF377 family glycosyl hydrolase
VTVTASLARRVEAQLAPDPARVVAKLFLPGEELPLGHSRAGAVIARVLALPEDEVERVAAALLVEFGDRHREYAAMLADHASMMRSQVQSTPVMSEARSLVLGASFTAEYAVEGAALCNPSAVLHPDQSGLDEGQARVAVSLRGIGEGHVSSVGFCSAIVGPGPAWTFETRALPIVAGSSTPAYWQKTHLRAVLADEGRIDGLARSVLGHLPAVFTGIDLEHALAEERQDLLTMPGGQATVALLRRLVASAYAVGFPADVELSQQVLLPSAPDESNGMEDARFVRFTTDDGSIEYRATYTAFDGRKIAPRLLVSPDLRTFQAHRLAGPAARNKGMALFPRMVGGRYRSLCRSDGESTSIATSVDGFVWSAPEVIQAPAASWEVLQVGNCGPPIETDQGWLVLTHGVGPMRIYSIGAMLLDLDDPAQVVAHLDRPFLQPTAQEQNGYVPNVVYSCGGVVHDGLLWLPYGIGDSRIGVAWVSVDELLSEMTPTRIGF